MRWFVVLMSMSQVAFADVVTSKRTLRPGTLITANDIRVLDGIADEAFERASDVIGQEARIPLYAGRPIVFDAVGPPAIVHRNQIVVVEFSTRGLVIRTEGRAMARGGIGDRIRVMNLDSRTSFFGVIRADGTIEVTQ